MKHDKENVKAGCNIGCRNCGASWRGGQDGQGALSGRRLSVAALIVFLVPLMLSVAGAAVAGPGPTARWIGATAGLAVGVASAILVGRLIRPASKEA